VDASIEICIREVTKLYNLLERLHLHLKASKALGVVSLIMRVPLLREHAADVNILLSLSKGIF
jgi:hypothetical protein